MYKKIKDVCNFSNPEKSTFWMPFVKLANLQKLWLFSLIFYDLFSKKKKKLITFAGSTEVALKV